MPNEFNEQEYRSKLIAGGLSEADATAIAARTSAARRDSCSAFRPAVALVELTTPAQESRAAVEQCEPTKLARTMSLPPKPRTVVNKIADQIDALAQEKRSSAMATVCCGTASRTTNRSLPERWQMTTRLYWHW